jgi:hypothetical protein
VTDDSQSGSGPSDGGPAGERDPLGQRAGDDGQARGGERASDGAGSPPAGTGTDGRNSQRDAGGPSLGRRIGIVLVALVLTLSIAGANGLLIGQRTALSSDYVTATMDDAGTFDDLEATAEETILDEAGTAIEGTGVIPDPAGTLSAVVDEVVTAGYLEAEVSRNLGNLYDYLHGRTDELGLWIETTPLTGNVSAAVERQVAEFPVADILQQSAIAGSFSEFGIDARQIGRAIENETAFNDLREQVQFGLEARNVSPEQINQTLRQGTELGDATPALRESVYRLEETIVWGLTAEVSHDRFRATLDDARAEFAGAAGEYAQQRVETQVEDRIDLTEGIAGSDRQQLDTAAGYVQLADTLTLVLPLIALVLVGLLLWLTHSIGRSALIVGGSLTVVGLVDLFVSLLAGDVAVDTVREGLAGGEPFVVSTAVALVEGVFGVVTQQGLVLVLAGVVLIAAGIALGRYQPRQVPANWR